MRNAPLRWARPRERARRLAGLLTALVLVGLAPACGTTASQVSARPVPLAPMGGRGGPAGSDESQRAAQDTSIPVDLALTFSRSAVRKRQTVDLRVVVDTHGQSVNAVQVYLSLPNKRLVCATDGESTTSELTVQATSCTSHLVAIALSSLPDSAFTGKGQVAVLHLKAGSSKGSATVRTDLDHNMAVVAGSSQNGLDRTVSAKVKVR